MIRMDLLRAAVLLTLPVAGLLGLLSLGRLLVVAFVVGRMDLEEARDWVAEVHPRAWAPRQVVALDEIPLLGNGKPDRSALARLAQG